MPNASGSLAGGHYSLAVVTTELYPFTAGGIGVVYGNMLRTYASSDKPMLVVMAGATRIDAGEAKIHYPNCAFVNVEDLLRNTSVLRADSFSRTADWHYRS